jgi:hypothetical protein
MLNAEFIRYLSNFKSPRRIKLFDIDMTVSDIDMKFHID